MIMPPCKVNGVDCQERYLGCHDTCPKYHKFKEAKRAEAAQREAENDKDSMGIQRSVKLNIRSFRKGHREGRHK